MSPGNHWDRGRVCKLINKPSPPVRPRCSTGRGGRPAVERGGAALHHEKSRGGCLGWSRELIRFVRVAGLEMQNGNWEYVRTGSDDVGLKYKAPKHQRTPLQLGNSMGWQKYGDPLRVLNKKNQRPRLDRWAAAYSGLIADISLSLFR